MGTAEMIIVFSALMALIALVTVGIDWIGKPLKHRRFIPRLYRFEDEKVPVDRYGNPDFGVHEVGHIGHAASPVPMQPAPMVVAQLPPAARQGPVRAAETVAVPAATTTGAGSAFSDSLTRDSDGSKIVTPPATQRPPAGGWTPGTALDATIEDRKPSLSTKAERYWMSIAATVGDSHFDEDNVNRMHGGKAPNRRNPRTGRTESTQLAGLRQATSPEQVQMSWPDEAIDPWSAS